MNYNPNNDEIIIQAFNDYEYNQRREEWNSHDYSPEEADKHDLNIPFYCYSYKDNKLTYLFKKEMPQSYGLVSNGNKVIYNVIHANGTMNTFIYDRNNKTEIEIKYPHIGNFLYLSEDGNDLYGVSDGIMCLDLSTNKIIECSNLKNNSYLNNGMLLKKYGE